MNKEIERIQVRPMRREDINRIIDIETDCFSMPWPYHSFCMEMKNKMAIYRVCLIDNVIASYGGMWLILGKAHITNVAVHSAYRRRGLGRLLMETLEHEARERRVFRISLEVRKSNQTAIRLYRSMGYCMVGVRLGYYQDNDEDAIIMSKEITGR